MKKLLAMAAILLIMGCSKITEGNIVHKWYEPPRDWIMFVPITIWTGKSSIMMFVPVFMHDDEDYCVQIEGYDDNGKLKKRTLYLDEKTWNSTKKNQYFVVDKDEILTDNHKKKRLEDNERTRKMAVKNEPEDKRTVVF